MKNRNKQKCKNSFLMIVLVLMMSVTAFADLSCDRKTDDGTKEIPISYEENPISYEKIPISYDVRSDWKTPVVKSQGNLGTCWALTATSALEAISPGEDHPVFSADHMSLSNGFDITQKEGGDYMMIMAYLASWKGPVSEEEDPYADGETDADAQPLYHVPEIQMLKGMEQNEIKEMILQYGPVQTSLYMSRKTTSAKRDYYQPSNDAYYYPEEEANNHDVLILGWDDAYPKENFKMMPAKDGAYLCQNTWGESFGDRGLFYVSYEDANIAKNGLVYCRMNEKNDYDHIYQTDPCGWQGQQGYAQDSCFFANVYETEGEEWLSAVGFYTTKRESEYEVYLVKGFEDESSLEERQYLTGGSIPNAGFHTIELEKEIWLEPEQRFAVVVWIRTKDCEKPVAVEMKKDSYTSMVTTEDKYSYLSMRGDKWENTQQRYGTNVCLKAYTKDVQMP